MAGNKRKITLGICVYNVEKYIRHCLECALAQDYENLEILLIDDGSTDDTARIIDEYAGNDLRLRVIHRENRGLAASRQQVIEEMQGEAIYWYDGDDHIDAHAVSCCADMMALHDADIVKTVISIHDRRHLSFRQERVFSSDEYLKLLLPDDVCSHLIGCLIRKELYEDVHHHAGYDFEDMDTFPKLADKAEKIILSDNHCYRYRLLRPGSITRSEGCSFKGYRARSLFIAERYQTYRDRFPKECQKVLRRFALEASRACIRASHDDDYALEKNILTQYADDILADKKISSFRKWLCGQIVEDGLYFRLLRSMH